MKLTYENLEQDLNIIIENREDKYEADLMVVLRGAAAIDAQKPMDDDEALKKWLHDNCERVSIDGPQLFIKARLASSSGAEYDVTDRCQVLGIAFDYSVSIVNLSRSKNASHINIIASHFKTGVVNGTLHQSVYGVIAQLGAEYHVYCG